MHHSLQQKSEAFATTFAGAALIGQGKHAQAYRLPNGNILKITCCGPSVDWLQFSKSRGAANPYYPRVIREHGRLYETTNAELHAFELEALEERSSWYWPVALSQQVRLVSELIARENAQQPGVSDETFWRGTGAMLSSAVKTKDAALADVLGNLFDLVQTYDGKAYPDFTSSAKRNILSRPSGEWVFLDPVAAIRSCKPKCTPRAAGHF